MRPVYDEQGCQRQTFPLLWCERCGEAVEPQPLRLPMLIADTVLRCASCDESLTLLRCMVDGVHDPSHQPGETHRFVAMLLAVAEATR